MNDVNTLTVNEGLDIVKIRKQFPILEQEVNGRRLVYLDNAATSQSPLSVVRCIDEYYSTYNSNIHRGVHHLSQKATSAYEEAREKVRGFINAERAHEIIFTSGTTASINLVADTLGRQILNARDEVLISGLEHHSNIVPWQMVCEEKGAVLKVIPVLDNGELDLEAFDLLLSGKTKILSIAHISNSLGTINPVKGMIAKAQAKGAVTVLDGAQAAPHGRIDVQDLDVDLYAFSGHKMYGPTGVGVLYGKESLLNEMPPWQGGGEMIDTVTFEKTTYAGLPHKFEAGTPNIAGGIALGAAIDFMNDTGIDNIAQQEKELLAYATSELKKIEGLRIIGEAHEKVSVMSFNIDGLHHYDVGTILDQLGIAVRTGHHCTQPLMARFGITGTIRASFAVYNTKEEIDSLGSGVNKAISMMK